MWVLEDVADASYEEKLYWSSIVTIIIAYLNNAHGKLWSWIKLRKMA
jgi:hypothetical protein